MLEGQAGIGKTTLWNAGVSFARTRHYRILACRPVEAEAKMAFAGLADLVGPLLDEALLQLPSPQKRALEMALLREDHEGPAPDARAIGTGLLNILRTVANTSPVLLAIDDIQWLDRPSAWVVEFAVRRLSDESVGILASRRLGESRRLPVDLAAIGVANYRSVQVGPVTAQNLDKILREHLDADFRAPTLRRLHDTSGGNPFFALEIARALQHLGEPPAGAPLPLPGNLRELIHRRLARLPRQTVEALTVAALLASPTIRIVAGERPDALIAGVDAGVISLDGEQIRFSHPLMASTLVADAPEKLRRRLHRRLAQRVGDTEQRARHLALAATGPGEAVGDALEEAAISAARRGAPTTATELAELASTLTPATDSNLAQRRKILAAEQLALAGDYPRAHQLLMAAVVALAAGPLRARALMCLGVVQAMGLGRWEDAFTTQEQAAAEAGPDLRLRFETERQLGWSLMANIRARSAEPHLRIALQLAEQLGDRVLLAEALAEVADLDHHLGLGVREDMIERCMALDTLSEHARLARNPLWALMQIYIGSGYFERARSALQTLLDLTRDRGEENGVPWVLYKMAELDLATGNWPQAAAYAQEAVDISVRTAQATVLHDVEAILAELDAYHGRADQARKFFNSQAVQQDREQMLQGRAVLGMLELSLGNPAAAWEWLAPLPAAVHDLGLEEPTVIPFWANAIEALIMLGRHDDARPMLEWLEERGRTLDRTWALATGARCRALFLAAQGDFAGALQAADRALVHHDRLRMPLERGRTLLAKGIIARRVKKKQSARALLQSALAIFEDLGAALWAEKARAELQRIGGRTRQAGLTETEHRIADLVADGKKNREIAQVTFLSVKTVEANLSRIYATLGVASRTELARLWLTREDSPAEEAADQAEGFHGFPGRFRVLRSR